MIIATRYERGRLEAVTACLSRNVCGDWWVVDGNGETRDQLRDADCGGDGDWKLELRNGVSHLQLWGTSNKWGGWSGV